MSVFLKLKPEISKQRLIITKLLELEILNICDKLITYKAMKGLVLKFYTTCDGRTLG